MPTPAEWDDLAFARAKEYRAAHRQEVPRETNISTAKRRLGAYLLDALLAIVTLGIGWIVWSLLAWRRGQSPAKQLLGMYVVHDGRRATWWRMCARELLCKGVAGAICLGLARPSYGLTLIPYYFWLCFNVEHQALWDMPAGTHVLEERWGG